MELIEPEIGLIVWQIILVLVIILAFYSAIKMYRLISKYLKLKTKYLQKKLNDSDL